MSQAIAYNQSDIYKRFKERLALTAPPLLRSIEYFDYEACEKDVCAIEAFISECLRSLELLATIALGLARDSDPVEDGLVDWLFNISTIIDAKILASPVFGRIDPDKSAALESAAADLAYAASILDFKNCKDINSLLAERGYLEHA